MHPLDIVFWTCLMLGGVYMLFTVLMGGISHAAGHLGHIGDALHLPHLSDVAGHHHAGHTGHVDAGHHGHGDHAHHADAHHHGDQGADGEGSSRFNLLLYVNPMSFAGFLLGFGGGGIIARLLGAPPLASSLGAVATGMGTWWCAWLLIAKVFGASQGTSHTRREEVIGVRAQVTAPISGQQPGMVALNLGGSRQTVRAVTDDEEPIPVGAAVRIRRIEDNTVSVMRIDG